MNRLYWVKSDAGNRKCLRGWAEVGTTLSWIITILGTVKHIVSDLGGFFRSDRSIVLTLILPTWSIGWAPNNASKWHLIRGVKRWLPNRDIILIVVVDLKGICTMCHFNFIYIYIPFERKLGFSFYLMWSSTYTLSVLSCPCAREPYRKAGLRPPGIRSLFLLCNAACIIWYHSLEVPLSLWYRLAVCAITL